ncbi:MAG: hypothetical protein Q9225_002512 [Loekoesia sp. 1 TL-2023]
MAISGASKPLDVNSSARTGTLVEKLTIGMGPPPTKRRKKIVVSSSEDEEIEGSSFKRGSDPPGVQASSNASDGQNRNHSSAKVLPTRVRSNHKTAINASKGFTTESNPPSSPTKLRSKPNNVRRESRPTSLDAYFSAGSTSRLAGQSVGQTSKPGTSIEEEDFIEDDSFDDELRRLSEPHKTGQGRDRETPAPFQSLVEKAGASKLPLGSQIFRKARNDVRKVEKDHKASGSGQDDTRPWADRYGPTSIEELAVHKKKVADVREWLEGVCSGLSTKSLLILKGAAGVGKTTTVSTIARALDLDIIEWKNPMVSDFASENYLSTSARFEDFLGRGGKFASLQIAGAENADTSHNSPIQRGTAAQKKIILVEEFPTISTSNTTALQLFRTSILRYLARNPAYINGSASKTEDDRDAAMPLVMIVTESQLNSFTSSNDNFTAHRLFGADILSHPNTDMIEFNSIAPTYITKALNLVIQKEARDSGRRRVPGSLVLKRLSEVGDVRSAIGSLEFLCLKSQDGEDWGGTVASKGKKGAKSAAALTNMEKGSLELATQREASLGLFHAVGKVVYNKREGPGEVNPPVDPPTQPPDHLPQHVRLKPPDVSVDDLVNETGTDTPTFVAALHENYVLSCSGNDFTDTLNACIEYLSDTDVLVSERGGRHRGNVTFKGVTTDSLRQDEIAFQVAVRGLLFSLPFPVKRGGPPPGTAGRVGGKGDAFKMFYPASMRLGRQMQEIEEMIEWWIRRQRDSTTLTAFSIDLYGGDGNRDEVASWAQRRTPEQSARNQLGGIGACIIPSKDAVVLETLPYAALIERHRPSPIFTEELDRITRVTGEVQPAIEGIPDELETEGSANKRKTQRLPAKAKPYLNGIQPRAGGSQASGASGSSMAVEQAVGHLYLSDDDIED